MVSSPPAGPPAGPDDRGPDASERAELSKPPSTAAEPLEPLEPAAPAEPLEPAAPAEPLEPAAPAEVDPPIWAIGPVAAPSAAPGPLAPLAPVGPVPADGPPYDAPPADWIPIVDETQYRATPRDLVLEAVTALAVAFVLAGLGAGLAYLWSAISPRVVLEMTSDGPAYVEPNPEGYVAGESVYLLMAVGVGILSAVAVWMLARKRRGPILLAGLAVGSVAGGVLMAWLGQRIGLSEYQRLLTDAPVSRRFEVPVKVRSAIIDLGAFKIQGAVLVQAMIAVAIYTLLAGFYPTVSLRPERAEVRFVPPGAFMMPGEPYTAEPAAGADAAGADAADGKRSGDEVSSDWPERSDPRAAQAPPAGG